jgi:hypothetical protein
MFLDNPFVISLICAFIAVILTAINIKASKEKITYTPLIKVGILVFGMVLLGLTLLTRNDSGIGSKNVEQDILTGSPDF